MAQQRLTLSQHVEALVANLPNGRLWVPKFQAGSNLYKLLSGLAPTFEHMDRALERYVDQSYPPTTEDFLAEWEAALGLPDSCFGIASTIAERQQVVFIKLFVLGGIQTEQDFVDLGALFGLTIQAHSGIDHVTAADGGYERYTPVLDIPTDFADVEEARHTLVIVETLPDSVLFPWEFPLLFASSAQNSLRCLIRKLAPANVNVLFVEA